MPAELRKAAMALIDYCATKTDSGPGGLGGIVKDLGKIVNIACSLICYGVTVRADEFSGD